MRTGAAVAVALGLAARAAAGDLVVTPQPMDEVFANPGMGWQTFMSFADDATNREGPPSASAYFRFTWAELEPHPGAIRFGTLDHLLARAKHAGQKLAIRVMCVGTDEGTPLAVPAWVKDAGCHGYPFHYEGSRTAYWAPDVADPVFQEAHLKFIAALGAHLDGNDSLDLVDVGTVGLWGEWHFSGTGVPMPPPAVQRSIIAAWVSAFPKASKVVQIGSEEGLKAAPAMRLGWRADCLGDWGGFSKSWSHMVDFYGPQVAKFGAGDLWRNGPVAFESCWDMRTWVEKGWSVAKTFDAALAFHASYFNDKSAPVPPRAAADVDAFLRKMGYRLVLRRMSCPAEATRGGSFEVAWAWDNVGVAPPYRDALEAVRLTRSPSGARILLPGGSIRGWLPGQSVEVTDRHTLPTAVPDGLYDVAVGVINVQTGEPEVRLAIRGRAADGWYPVGQILLH